MKAKRKIVIRWLIVVGGFLIILPVAWFLTHRFEGEKPIIHIEMSSPVITASTPFFGAGAPWENVPNPTDPLNLTPEQVARTVAFSFVNTSSFELRLGIGPGGKTENSDWGDGGRNFLFTGSISAVPEPTTALIWSMLVGLGMTVRRRR